ANQTPFGLGSYVMTTDPEQGKRVADGIEAGMVYVNLVLADSPELPFGGFKRSGFGRELGTYGADEFVNKKLVRRAGALRWSPARFNRPDGEQTRHEGGRRCAGARSHARGER